MLDRRAHAVHRLLTLMSAVHMTAMASKVSCVLYAGLVPLLKSEARGDAELERTAHAVHRLLALMLAVHMTATASKVGASLSPLPTHCRRRGQAR